MAPQRPADLTATAVSTTQINLTWRDCSPDETSFRVERSTDNGQSWQLRLTVPANTTSASDVGLTPATNYCYRVRAHDSNTGSTSEPSNTACAQTHQAPSTPEAPTQCVAIPLSKDQIRVEFTDNATDETGFVIAWSKDQLNWTELEADPNSGNGRVTNNRLIGLEPATTYYVRVAAFNAIGRSQWSNTATASTLAGTRDPAGGSTIEIADTAPVAGEPIAKLPIGKPLNPQATAGPLRVTVTWTDNSEGEDRHEIFFAFTEIGPWQFAGSVPKDVTSFAHLNRPPGRVHYYKVRASEGPAGQRTFSQFSEVVSATPLSERVGAQPIGGSKNYQIGGSTGTRTKIIRQNQNDPTAGNELFTAEQDLWLGTIVLHATGSTEVQLTVDGVVVLRSPVGEPRVFHGVKVEEGQVVAWDFVGGGEDTAYLVVEVDELGGRSRRA